MFETPKRLDAYAEAQAAGERAFATLVGYVKECQSAGALRPGDSKSLALIAWSMLHGVAKLAIGGQLPFSKTIDVLHFTDTATGALAVGLASASARSDS